MKHGSLFSGMGGFDLAADWMGWENVFHCEWNLFGQRILNYYWPKAKSYNDITKTDFTIHRGQIDILTGGFPCQPYSQAGKRLGKEDDRHLWPEMLRAIREIQPSYVVGENVRGLTNWNGGLVFDEVQADLEAEGYEVLPFLLPACAVNAPHRRDRIWFVAYSASDRKASNGSGATNEGRGQTFILPENKGRKVEAVQSIGLCGLHGNATDTPGDGLEHGNESRNIPSEEGTTRSKGRKLANGASPNGEDATETGSARQQKRNLSGKSGKTEQPNWRDNANRGNWQDFPTQSPVCSRNDGLPTELDGITFSKWRNESIKAAGNAIVPQVALQIFKAIQEMEQNL